MSGNDWLFSIDLTDAYHLFLLTNKSRRLFGHKLRLTHEQVVRLEQTSKLLAGFTRVEVEPGLFEVFVRPVGIPMGFKHACAIWTKIARVWIANWRRVGKRLVHLLDDFMFAVDGDLSFEDNCEVRDEVLAGPATAGAQMNWKKSILTPSKCLRFWGMLVETSRDSVVQVLRA